MSIRRGSIVSLAFLIALPGIGQQHFQYVPGQQGIPLLYRKGQLRADLAVQWCTNTWDITYEMPIRGTAIRAAYAWDDRWGIIGGFDHHSMDVTSQSGIYSSNGSPPRYTYYRDQGRWTYGEIGAGRYRMFARNWIGEVYGLIGYGTTANEWPNGFRTEARQFGLSAQANWGRAVGYFEFAVANRFRFFTLSDIRSSRVLGPNEWLAFELELMGQGPFLTWEPALLIRGGWKHVRFSFQVGFSADVYGTMPERADLNVGLGLNMFLPGTTNPR